MIRATSYTEQAREVIKHLIFSGTYKPGERLKEAELSKQLGISRSPVREAIQSLANEGLVRLAPQRGAFVAAFDVGEIRELYEVRIALECLAVRRAVEKATFGQLEELGKLLKSTEDTLKSSDSASYPRDLDFHRQICRLAQNDTLLDHASEIHAQLQLARLRSSSKPGRARKAYEEHVAIYEALKEGNVEKAGETMRSHLRNGLESTLKILANPETGVA